LKSLLGFSACLLVALVPAARSQEGTGTDSRELAWTELRANHASGSLVLSNVSLIDGTGAPPRLGSTIVVKDGKIAEIHDSDGREPPEGATAVDLSGRFVIPGLMNGHVHLTAHRGDSTELLRTILHRGVTAVRDLGGDTRSLAVLARDARVGALEAPDIYYAATFFGPAFARNPRVRFSSMGLEAGTAPWARAATLDSDLAQLVAEAKGTGATGLKLYASLEPQLIARITEEAHRQGLKVWAHGTVFPSKPSEVLGAGVDELVHIFLLYSEASGDPLPDTWTAGFGEWLAKQEHMGSSPRSDAQARLYASMAARGTYVDTTLHVANRLALLDEGAEPGWSPSAWRSMEAWNCEAMEAAHRAGVKLVAGTDYDGTLPIQEEMSLLVDCGLSPLEAIKAATLHVAETIGIELTHGSIEPGKVADLVVLASDPLEDIDNTADVQLVMKAGRVYEPPKSVN